MEKMVKNSVQETKERRRLSQPASFFGFCFVFVGEFKFMKRVYLFCNSVCLLFPSLAFLHCKYTA